ncbi:MAG: hypothetical protein CTR53_07100 [Ferrovibrio sp.]|nr:MAG: hypothetical protein CTR53_07100 [Ferrovibrio sp.]
MAHYVAECIDKAQSAEKNEKSELQKHCFETILQLWRHHAELPNGMRPFEELEPIIRALESLDPENTSPRYFQSVRSRMVEVDLGEETQKWVETISGIDYTARILIEYCLKLAAHSAMPKAEKWVTLAAAADASGGIPEVVIKFIGKDSDLDDEVMDDITRKKLQERLDRLKAFTTISKRLAKLLENQLKIAPTK